MKKEVRSFYERDNFSRITTSKTEPIRKQKIKKQRRLLCETLKTLYLKFKAEHAHMKLSHNTIEIVARYDPEDLVKYLQWKTAADENGNTITVNETKTQSLQGILETFLQTME